jgi:thiosulfate reductase cytochrome b subunit
LVSRDLRAALTFRLGHRLGHYNAVQRLLYISVIAALLLQVVTGLAIWKPVQLGALVNLFGGYPIARNIHLANMLLIVAFVIVHVVLVGIFPRTLVSMIVGLPAEPKS